MKISALFHQGVVTCSSRDTVEEAACLLWRHDIGCLPVLDDDGRLAGMITDRDIAMAAFIQGSPLRAITVSSVMSDDVDTCCADDDIDVVVHTLVERQLRRLPVIDDGRRVIGIVSLNDLARAACANKLPPATIAAVLTAISVPRALAAAAA